MILAGKRNEKENGKVQKLGKKKLGLLVLLGILICGVGYSVIKSAAQFSKSSAGR